jgi:succinate dehydrogenase / fumarate reductase cytochrome b subunit
MSVTGLFLISFLVVHVSVNACIFKDAFDPTDNGDMFNRAAQFWPHSCNTINGVCFVCGVLYPYYTRTCRYISKPGKRKIGYEVNLGNRSKWYSRSMGLLGTILYCFCFFIGGISGYHQDLHMQV